MQQTGELVVSLVTAFIGLAVVAVVLSQKSNTTNVLSAFGSTLSSILGAALSPITGSGGSGIMSGGSDLGGFDINDVLGIADPFGGI